MLYAQSRGTFSLRHTFPVLSVLLLTAFGGGGGTKSPVIRCTAHLEA